MRILHLGKYYPPYRGGVETVMESICRGLAARGAEVTALVANDSPETVIEQLDGVRVHRLGRKYLAKRQPVCPGLGKALADWRGDFVHLHFPNPLAVWSCLRANPAGKWLSLHHSDIVRQRLLSIPANWLLRRFLRRAAAVTVPTPRHIEFSDVLPEFRDKCRVIHFGIDPAPFASAENSLDRELPDDWKGRPLLLFVGRLVYYKGLEVLLRALGEVPEAVLAVVGEGPEEQSLKTLAGSVPGRVAFLGEVSGERLRQLYRRADVFVLPSIARSEAFGMVQLEAMAAGTPVISTDLPSGVPYVNVSGETGLVVPPCDAAALAGAIRRLAEYPEDARRMGQAGQQRVERHFTEKIMIDGYMKMYEELLA